MEPFKSFVTLREFIKTEAQGRSVSCLLKHWLISSKEVQKITWGDNKVKEDEQRNSFGILDEPGFYVSRKASGYAG